MFKNVCRPSKGYPLMNCDIPNNYWIVQSPNWPSTKRLFSLINTHRSAKSYWVRAPKKMALWKKPGTPNLHWLNWWKIKILTNQIRVHPNYIPCHPKLTEWDDPPIFRSVSKPSVILFYWLLKNGICIVDFDASTMDFSYEFIWTISNSIASLAQSSSTHLTTNIFRTHT